MPNKLHNQRDPDLDVMSTVSKMMLEQAIEQQKRRKKRARSDPDAEAQKQKREMENRQLMLVGRLNALIEAHSLKRDPQQETPELRAEREQAARLERIEAMRAQRAKEDARIARKLERARRRHRRVKALQLALAMSKIELRPGGRRRPTPGRRPIRNDRRARMIERESGGN